MTNLTARVAALPPARRRLLERRLAREGLAVPAEPAASATSIPRRPHDGPHPLSFGQQRLWFIHRLAPESPAYNIPFAGRLRGRLDAALLRRGLAEVVRRQEILRTRFEERDGEPVQVIDERVVVTLPLVDLAGLPQAARESELERLYDDHPSHLFDLERGPVWRVHLARLAADDHALLVTLHHILTDAWSMAVLFRELPAAYDALRERRPSPFGELAVQVADHAHWQRERFRGELLERELGVWRRYLEGAPTVLDLPFDRPRPPAQTLVGRRFAVAVPQDVTDGLRRLAERRGVTMFMALLAAFDVLLYRYTGQDDLLVGSPFATREQEETHPLIGFFINIAVLRARLDGRPGFHELLERVRVSTLATLAHQELPFEKLLEVMKLERDPSRPPLVQVYFVLQNVHIPRPEFAEIDVPHVRQTDTRSARVDLTFGLWEVESLQGWFEYNVDLFDRSTVARMARHFNTLLAAAVADPEWPIDALALLAPAERHQLLVEMSGDGNEVDMADGDFVHRRFETWAARTPEATAVVAGDAALSYGELEARAEGLGRRLRRRGVGPEVRVGLCLERTPALVVAILGVWKAGGAWVPLDPSHPDERRRRLADDAGVELVLTDADIGAEPYEPDDTPSIPARPDHAAYVLYTSGSTGQPKGVVITHRNVARLIGGCQPLFDFAPDDVWTLFHAYAFDFSVWEMWGALACGGRLVIVPHDVSRAPRAFLALLANAGVTVLNQTPSAFRQLVTAEREAPERAPGLALRRVFFGGEALYPEDVAPWLERRRGVRLVNMYGITETTVHVTWRPMRRGETRGVIGRPLPDFELHLLDRDLEPVPIGVAGEIHVAGAGLARAYHGRSGHTAERFVPHPFAARGGARLYRSGDLARRLGDGDVEYLGRLDHQVQLRGFRVEPGEIEAALRELPEVREAVAAVRVLGDGARLVAWTAPAVPDDWRDRLRRRLPDYMMPTALAVLDTLPRTPTGKLDRRGLTTPAPRAPSHDFAAPRDAAEITLARIWEKLLAVERVGADDDFFALGGDSILGIRMLSRAAAAGLRLEPRELFAHPTLAAMAAAARPTPDVASREPLVGDVPLAPVQRWFFELDVPESDHWNMAVLLELRRRLAPAVPEAALARLEEHHDMLRTRFEHGADGWRQAIAAPGGRVPFTRVDLAPGTTLDDVASHVHRSLNLAAGPVWRAVLVGTGGDAPDRLLLVIHHLVIDGVSWRVLFEDLAAAIAALEAGAPIVLPPKTTSYRGWVEHLEAWAGSAEARRELEETWLARGTPAEGSADPGREADAESVDAALDAETTRVLLGEVPEASRIRVDEVLVTALAETLAARTGERRVRLALESHGREPFADGLDLSRTVGWFTAIHPVELDLRQASTPAAALAAVKEALRRLPRRGAGWGVLRHLGDADTRARLAAVPRPEVSFNYLGRLDPEADDAAPWRLAASVPGPLRSPGGERAHGLEITAFVLGGELRLVWTSNRRLHGRAELERLADRYLDTLRELVGHGRAAAVGFTPSDFPHAGLDQAQLDKILGRSS